MKKIVVSLLVFFFCSISYAKTIKILVFDTGYSGKSKKLCKGFVHFDGEKNVLMADAPSDEHGHGTHVLDTIEKNITIDNYCFIVFKAVVSNKSLYAGYLRLAKTKVDVVNMSYASNGDIYDSMMKIERQIIIRMKKTKFIVAAGNESFNMNRQCDVWPVCLGHEFDNVIGVAGTLDEGIDTLHPSSNHARWINSFAPFCNKELTFCGTSHAAPYWLAKNIKSLINE